MTFSEHLKGIADGVGGVLGVALADMDGIIIEEYLVDPNLDMTTIVAEYSPLWSAVDKAGTSINLGPSEEINLLHGSKAVIVKKINAEYFLLLGLESEEHLGKGRYYAKMAAAAIFEEL